MKFEPPPPPRRRCSVPLAGGSRRTISVLVFGSVVSCPTRPTVRLVFAMYPSPRPRPVRIRTAGPCRLPVCCAAALSFFAFLPALFCSRHHRHPCGAFAFAICTPYHQLLRPSMYLLRSPPSAFFFLRRPAAAFVALIAPPAYVHMHSASAALCCTLVDDGCVTFVVSESKCSRRNGMESG